MGSSSREVSAVNGASRARAGSGQLEQESSLGTSLVADMDYVTALCSQVVYEGLVDDTFRIKCGRSLGKGTGWHFLHALRASRVCAGCCQPLGVHAAARAVPVGQFQQGALRKAALGLPS